MSELLVAIAPFLRSCSRVVTLGVRTALGDYSRAERELMLAARLIFFPTLRFVKIFEAAGKSTFPNGFTYTIRKSRVVEEVLFQFLACPHPRTRIYFGRQKKSIPEHFSFPFLAMGANKSGMAHLLSNVRELEELAVRYNPLIIQENIEYEDRFRMTFVNYDFVGIDGIVSSKTGSMSARGMPSGGFVENLIDEVGRIVKSAGLNDIGVDVGIGERGWSIIEFARPPVFCSTPGGMVAGMNIYPERSTVNHNGRESTDNSQ